MQTSQRVFILFISIFVSGFLLIGAPAVRAMTPVITSITATGSGDYAQINVTGDPGASVILFSGSSMIPLSPNLPQSGTYSYSLGSSQSENQTAAIASNAAVYVKTGGINGSMSNQVVWPYVQNTTIISSITFSQVAVLLNVGQTSTITASVNALYLLSNSSPAVANINFNANQITIQALTYGSTVANVCAVGSTANCANITITVQNSNSQQLSFSQNNFSVYSGQNVPVTITGGAGNYTITNNSNSGAVQANLSGSTVTLSATGTAGSSSITVCTGDMAGCGIINVNSSAVNSTAISFSQTNPVVPLGQTATVTIYGGTGNNFYVSSNSNPSIVQANISGNILTLIGNASSGTSAINICAVAGSCSSLTANVSSAGGANGSLLLSQNSVSILAGQSSSVTISGGSTPYSISSNSPNIFNGAVNGNILTIYGVNPGSSTANICSPTGCVVLPITINSATLSANPPAFSQNNILLNTSGQATVNISGTGNYYVSSNSSPAAVSVMINGNTATVVANNPGAANISICQSNGQCSVLYATVSASPTPAPTPAPIATQPAYVFPRYLGYGDKGEDVLMLQTTLARLGFLSATPNGNYGPATKTAVKKFQQAHGIKQTGSIGPSTKDALNQIQLSSATAASGTENQQIATIQQAIQQLLSQVAQIQK